jgi:cyanate permease
MWGESAMMIVFRTACLILSGVAMWYLPESVPWWVSVGAGCGTGSALALLIQEIKAISRTSEGQR